MKGFSFNSVVMLSAMAIVLLISLAGTDAKRGCANFGHSCYGGMGKRAEYTAGTNDEVIQDVQQDENPEFVFTGPRSLYKPQPDQKLTAQEIYNLSPFIRQWLRNYRNSQELQAIHGNSRK